MDPNVLVSDLLVDLEERPRPTDIPERLQHLYDWLTRGGFVPTEADTLVIALYDNGYKESAYLFKDVLNDRRGLPT